MAKPTRAEIQGGLTAQQLIDRFRTEVIVPQRTRVEREPSLWQSAVNVVSKEAREYFWSEASRFPSWKGAILFFAQERLELSGVEPGLIKRVTQAKPSDRAGVYNDLALWIVYSEAPWTFQGKEQPGLEALVAKIGGGQAPKSSRSGRPQNPPSVSTVELASRLQELESELLVLNRLAAGKKQEVEEVRLLWETAAQAEQQEKARREEAARKAEEERKAREAAENLRREEAARKKEEERSKALDEELRRLNEMAEQLRREEAARKAEEDRAKRAEKTKRWAAYYRELDLLEKEYGTDDFASILGVYRPFTEEGVKNAYRKRSKETHPDHGGSAAEFQKVNAAYKVACLELAVA